jgi:SOS-response transcriptional repressor LexA
MLSTEKIRKLQAVGLVVELDGLTGTAVRLPLYRSPVRAGLPAAVENEIEESLDLLSWFTTNPERSFLVRVEGVSMVDFGIHDGDLLVVESGHRPKVGAIVIASLNDEYTVKRLGYHNGKLALLPGNARFAPIPVVPGEMRIAGIVRGVLRRL